MRRRPHPAHRQRDLSAGRRRDASISVGAPSAGRDVRRLVVSGRDRANRARGRHAEPAPMTDVFTSGGVRARTTTSRSTGSPRHGRPGRSGAAARDLLRGFYRRASTNGSRWPTSRGRGARHRDALVSPAIVMRNVYILPGVPRSSGRSSRALRERSRRAVPPAERVRQHERGHARRLPNDLLQKYSGCCSSPTRVLQPAYKVKVTLESATQST